MACCRHCSVFIGEDSECGPLCGKCGQPLVYCSEEACSVQECALRGERQDRFTLLESSSSDQKFALRGERPDYFGLSESGSSDEDLRSLSRRGPRWDPFY